MTCPNMRTIRQIVTRLSTYGDSLSGTAFCVVLTIAIVIFAIATGWGLNQLIGAWGAPFHAAFSFWLGYSVIPRMIEHRTLRELEREQRGRVDG